MCVYQPIVIEVRVFGNDPGYIYIYIYVCVCVCVYIYVGIHFLFFIMAIFTDIKNKMY